MNIKNLLIRSITGLVLVFVMLTCIASENGWYFTLWAVIGLLSIWEFLSLIRKNRHNLTHSLPAVGTVGVVYIALAMVLLWSLYSDWQYVVVLMTLVWTNDIAAYGVGSVIGKHPLAPKISPKKSIEGCVAGILATIAVALLWWLFYFKGLTTPTDSSTTAKALWALMGLVVAVGAIVGDLIESKFKRTLKIKDSGKLLAGHGGMLDRFDALFASSILFWLYINFILPLLQI